MFDLNFQSKIPIYEQLYKNIVKMVVIGLLKPNQQLIAIRTLAKELEINPNTVQKAYHMLENDNIIYSIPGKGSFLSPSINILDCKKKSTIEDLKELVLEASLIGVSKEEIINIIDEIF